LEGLSDIEFKDFRKWMISNILSTDMSEHFKLLKSAEARLKECQEEQK
jgi:calcium/calmodulin-dependent 3',5'-cyclic nucleotide phosphodiesterase